MADIFLSYASEDRERVRVLVERLEAHGWEVWWDRDIPPGMTWQQVLEDALDRTRVMVVVWSRASVASRWVQVEASVGWERDIVVPVSLDDAHPPLQYRLIQAAKLADWDGSPHDQQFQALVAELEKKLTASSNQPEPARVDARPDEVPRPTEPPRDDVRRFDALWPPQPSPVDAGSADARPALGGSPGAKPERGFAAAAFALGRPHLWLVVTGLLAAFVVLWRVMPWSRDDATDSTPTPIPAECRMPLAAGYDGCEQALVSLASTTVPRAVFAADGRFSPDTIDVPGAFTAAGYAIVTAKLNRLDLRIAREVRARYDSEYQARWIDYLHAARPGTFATPADAARKLQVLASGSSSPSSLLNFLSVPARNMRLESERITDSFIPLLTLLRADTDTAVVPSEGMIQSSALASVAAAMQSLAEVGVPDAAASSRVADATSRRAQPCASSNSGTPWLASPWRSS